MLINKQGRVLVRVCIKLISFYKFFISPLLGKNCRFYPSCSNYFQESLVEYGFLKGFYKGFIRILRCNRFFPGGYDPVKKIDTKSRSI